MARILIADDRADDRYLYRTILGAAGHEMTEAASGREALERARERPPDLLICDILMPQMDGFQLGREWAADPVLRHVPFIYCSANYLRPRDLKLARDLGAVQVLVKPVDAATLRDAVEAALEAETAGGVTGRLRHLDEAQFQERHVEAVSHKIVEKIRELEAVNQRLARQERAFRLLFDANPQPMWVYDRQSLAFLMVNDAAVRHYGYSREEFLAMSITDIRPAEEVPHLRQWLAHKSEGQPSPRLWRHRRKSGEIRLVEIAAHSLDFLDRPAMLILATDVTERVHGQQALRTSEERFRLLSKATSDVVWDWSLADDTVWWNEGFGELFGYRREEIEPDSRSWTSRIHGDDRDVVVHSIQRNIEQGPDNWQTTYRFRRADGSFATVRDRGFIIRDDSGRAVRMLGGMTDISERQALENQLRHAQRLEAVGQLTGGIAHDFNNLLTVILGSGELLASRLADNEENSALARMIATAAERGAELTRRLLAFARRQALQPRVVDVNALITDMGGMLRRTLGEHVEVRLALEPKLRPALIDPVQLEHALLNLCINARDAMSGGGRLTIETDEVVLGDEYTGQQEGLSSGEYVLVAVSDTGTGIPPEHLPRLFEPFFTTKEPGKGTGLGLPMVYGFVKQSRGHVAVYSEIGHGTSVKLYLPHADGGNPVAQAEPDAARRVVTEETAILLVEDDPAVRRFARFQLVELGYRVLEAGDGPAAMDVLRENSDITLLFTDLVMPGGMTGSELAAAARSLRPGLKVLFTTGYAQDAVVHTGRVDPEATLLPKPYRRHDLLEAVQLALQQP